MSTDKPLNTIIIGAGFAGLAAAKSLAKQGRDDFVILEARDRVGGRTKHGQIAGLDIDLGGMWLGPTQTKLAEYADEYGLKTYETYLDGKGIYNILGKEYHGKREHYQGLFSVLETLRYAPTELKLNRLVDSIDCEQPWNHKDAKTLDATTVEAWIQKHIASETIKQTYRVMCWSLFCAEADQMSMLFFLHYLKSGGGLDLMLSADEGGAQNFMFHGGVQQIARKIAEELSDRLHLSEPAMNIQWNDEGVTVTTPLGRYKANHAIIAVPPPLVSAMGFEPALPQPKEALHRRLTMGSVIKYWIAYDKPFWREQGFNGMIIGDHSPALPCFDATPPEQPLGVIAGFFDADESLEFAEAGEEQRKQIVIELLARHYGDSARSPVDYVDNDWTSKEWSQGCYGAYAAPGVYSRYGEWLSKPIGPLHWAGTETSAVWTGYIDGAIRSGERAAAEV